MIYGNFQTETGVLRQQTYKKQGNVMLKKIKKFFENTSGSILPTMGILAVPLTIAIGAAVDYTRYTNARTEIQTGVDAAGIATVAAITDIKLSINSDLEGDAYRSELETKLTEYAKNFLDANITSDLAKQSYTFNLEYIPATRNTGDSVSIQANLEYDTIFGGTGGKDGGILLFDNTINDNIKSIINTGNRTVEIALVVDNSGSMSYEAGNLSTFQNPAAVANRRITLLQTAANQLIDDLFDVARDAQLPDPVQFSIVPFSSTVNVGPIDHENHDDGNNFLDINGFSSIHNENLDWANTYRRAPGENVTYTNNNRTAVSSLNGSNRFLTRLDIFEMLNTEWEGCVEMRPWPHNIRNSYRGNNQAYHSTHSDRLFVPYMVPDAPDREYFDYYSDGGKRIETEADAFGYSNSYIPDFYDFDHDDQLAFPRFLNDNNFIENRLTNDDINGNNITRTNWISKYQAFQGLDEARINALPNGNSDNSPERQRKRILQNIDIPTFEKDLSTRTDAYFRDSGPNAFCPDIPIVQLTDDRQKLMDTINDMEAHGGTNIQQGLTWGWRTLSAARPFTAGRSLTDVENRKILILLTDGANQYLSESTSNLSRYGAWGYQRTPNVLKHATTDANSHGRLSLGTNNNQRRNTIYETQYSLGIPNPFNMGAYFEDLMNLHTNQACNNIKSDGISIYTIAFDVPGDGKIKDLLEHCSGSGLIDNNEVVRGVQFYHDVRGLDLQKTFAEIAQSISAIRIAQ